MEYRTDGEILRREYRRTRQRLKAINEILKHYNESLTPLELDLYVMEMAKLKELRNIYELKAKILKIEI